MKADAIRGHLDALILAVVEREPLHGYAIIEELRARSGGELDMPTGSLYPALRRLERAGFLESEWNSASGRDRRTYRLTDAGRKHLKDQRHDWRKFADVIEGVLRP
ncbi:MAG TPA: PadR family transcriptional regulator, partial [Candidatus Limnocylindrales bacterium]|nr:PadR family transcriptional regulator [Candidatus Limnocylindrales bacterium]